MYLYHISGECVFRLCGRNGQRLRSGRLHVLVECIDRRVLDNDIIGFHRDGKRHGGI